MQSSKNMVMFKHLCGLVGALCLGMGAAHAALPELQGRAAVNVTSDTAATAKNMAFDEARRQIITDTLSQYSVVEQLRAAVRDAKSSDLTNLIASSSIDGEQQSDTTYSANITMSVNPDAARAWMTANNVQNWLGDGTGGDMSVVLITTSDKVANWMELNRIARAEKIDFNTKYIMGNQITLEIPAGARGAFTAAARNAGWRYADQDGVLRLWK